ncbi:hypothetical protein [Empedobacter falsenii]|uniref:hypothetical protein n=1 Tax=Empedobacter falsenii TaxID=343874 RepID=UPI003A80B71C
MYRGFNIKCKNHPIDESYFKIGSDIQNTKKEEIKNKFKNYLINNEILNGNSIMEEWFPKNNYHIFLSHSHKDLKLALSIAGILKEEHNLDVFVDSNIWLNSNDLLKIIDNEFYRNSDDSYNYKARNYSTSHVHMMLMNSLNSTINTSEALFFLNTPNSISAKEVIKQETYSPWIFSEIETSKIINKITPERLYRKTRFFSKSHQDYVALNESTNRELQISYELELGHLTDLSSYEFEEWISTNFGSPEKALDELYNYKNLKNILIK